MSNSQSPGNKSGQGPWESGPICGGVDSDSSRGSNGGPRCRGSVEETIPASGRSRELLTVFPPTPPSSPAPVRARDPDSGGQWHCLGAARQSSNDSCGLCKEWPLSSSPPSGRPVSVTPAQVPLYQAGMRAHVSRDSVWHSDGGRGGWGKEQRSRGTLSGFPEPALAASPSDNREGHLTVHSFFPLKNRTEPAAQEKRHGA